MPSSQNNNKVSDSDSLQAIKDEVLKELSETDKQKNTLAWGSAVITTVLVILTLFSIVQTVQSASILSKINSGGLESAGTTSDTSPLPSNLNNLPNMVGGC